ncbi:MAG TPA: Maf family protein [Ruania sp.]|nr:Maf family protein [Ruania sp.]
MNHSPTAAGPGPDQLVLASASPARAALLRGAGIEPVIHVSHVDEEAELAAHAPSTVAASVQVLARAKARAVAAELAPATPSAPAAPLVLGCDSLLEFEGQALGKPQTPERAIQRWRRIRGRSGVLHTGHHLCAGGGQSGGVSSTRVHFAEVTDAEIEAYVATGEPLHVAGAFTIDGYGGAFITSIEGDHHGVIGLSLPLLRELLPQVGYSWVQLWACSQP